MVNLDYKNLISNYTEALWPDFKIFIRKNFGDKYILQDKVFFDWQYCNNPYNRWPAAAMKVLSFKNRFLGYLGLIPLKLKVFDEVIDKGGMLCNLMIDQSCRALGLGSYLIQSATDDFDILWGTGYTLKTGPMYEKLGGWKLIGDLNRYIKVINDKKISLLMGENILKDVGTRTRYNNPSINIKSIKYFSNNIEEFWQKISVKYPIAAYRDTPYLNWRYVDHPSFHYNIFVAEQNGEIKGYIVFRIAQSEGGSTPCLIGHILDLIGYDDAVGPLIAKAEEFMTENKVDLIDYFSTGSFHHQDFINLGYHDDKQAPYGRFPIYFNPVDWQKTNKINLLVYYGKALQNKDRLCEIDNWYITKGDGDKDRPNPH